MAKYKTNRVAVGEGISCPRCGVITTRYEHGPNFVPKAGRGSFPWWFICHNADCPTTVIYDDIDTYLKYVEAEPETGGAQVRTS